MQLVFLALQVGEKSAHSEKSTALTISSVYTNGNPMCATKKPLIAGPTTEPIWNTLLFQVTAFENASRGTKVGKKELRAAQLKV